MALLFRIEHHRGLMGRLNELLSGWRRTTGGPRYFETLVTEEGIVISRLLRGPIQLPWDNIRSVDLAGLEPPNRVIFDGESKAYRLLAKLVHRRRIFFLLSLDETTLQDGALRGVGRRIWQPATNVVGVTDIQPRSAGHLVELLIEMCSRRGILLDRILLDWED